MTTTRRLSAAYDARMARVRKEYDALLDEYRRRVSGEIRRMQNDPR